MIGTVLVAMGLLGQVCGPNGCPSGDCPTPQGKYSPNQYRIIWDAPLPQRRTEARPVVPVVPVAPVVIPTQQLTGNFAVGVDPPMPSKNPPREFIVWDNGVSYDRTNNVWWYVANGKQYKFSQKQITKLQPEGWIEQ